MYETWLEDNLALLPDCSEEQLAEALQSDKFTQCLWLTANAVGDELNSQAHLTTLSFPLITTPDDSFVAPVAEAIAAAPQITGSEKLLVASPAHNLLGIWLAYYLMQTGAAPVHAVARVRATLEQCFVEDGWDQFAYDVLYHLQA